MADTDSRTSPGFTGTSEVAPAPAPVGRGFVLMIACTMGMTALSIDVLLPAFADMRKEFGLAPDSTAVSRLITAFLLGLAVGQIIYGPLSDRYGRKRPLFIGLVLFIAGGVATSMMTTLTGVVIWRFVWGLGAAASRSLALAMVRDTFEGDRMARTMSHVMATFILVPVFAPGLGSLAMTVAPWRIVFWIPITGATLLCLWMAKMPETLPPHRRRPVSLRALGEALRVVLSTRETVAFGLAATCLFGIITGYIGTTEIIIDEVFDQADHFALLFGFVACMFGLGALLSARVVMRIGLDRLLRLGAIYVVAVALGFAILAALTDGRPPLWTFVLSIALLLTGVTALTPNCNTAAMTPVPHVAGMAAAVLGTIGTGGGAVLGSILDRLFDGTVRAFAYGALVYAALAAIAILFLSGGTGRIRRSDAAKAATAAVTVGDTAMPGEPV